METQRTYVIPAHLITSGPEYLIGLKHGKEGRAVVMRHSPVYCNGWAKGYEEAGRWKF